ncbi:hypothetical protein IPD43_00390 [Paenibacillus polymyxa]|uniref:hypothetical protein n=1 Tax=Paenibacillus polymyxa TaxID=1406 RepID=UPI0018C3C36F|nr:hypothetical protein [Paenibacillus polymyxa]MBE7896097.1 hypothetical protein [Paenibacillus polymyxa]QPK54881.1 hypothetical protein G7035_20700 [Paenibacillus polymyxa]
MIKLTLSEFRFELLCDGHLVNRHSDGGKYYGWGNPFDVLPPVGSIVEYKTFNQGSNPREGDGLLSKYVVKNYLFTTEEDYNHTYRHKVCKIIVDKINQ